MNRLISWIKRQGDDNSVSYSRFGLPGEETDDRPPPREIYIAPFHETDTEYYVCKMHIQRAALISAGIGMSLTIFTFMSVFFEFNWYSHRRGVDVLALVGLILFLVCGLMTHWHVVVGVKKGHPKYLLPFIVVYTVMIIAEGLLAIFGAYHYSLLSSVQLPDHAFASQNHAKMWRDYHSQVSSQMLFGCLIFLLALLAQSAMLWTVVRCRMFLSRKLIHAIELRVAEKSKLQHPNMAIVEATSSTAIPNDDIAENGVVHNPNFVQSSHIGVVNDSIGTPPPNYERSVRENGNTDHAPTRTLFTSSDVTN